MYSFVYFELAADKTPLLLLILLYGMHTGFVNIFLIMVRKILTRISPHAILFLEKLRKKGVFMHKLLEQYQTTVAFLSESLPKTWEVLLFDLTQKNMPVVENKQSSRKRVDSLRSYIRQAMKRSTVLENGMLVCRGDVTMGKGLSKVSIQFLRDSEGTLVGALVLYIELTPFVALSSHIDNLLHFDVTNIDEIQPVQPPAPTEEPTLELIDKMVSEFSDAPDRLTPDEKTELIIDLYDSGVLDLKGAVAKTAQALRMSEQSIYRYVAKVKRGRGE
jgi:predicted transcriptional regulator YheO